MFLRRVLAVLGAAVFLAACSSDDPTSIGRELADDILGSRPGVVFQDSIVVSADTIVAFNTLIASSADLELGLGAGYRRAMILQPEFSSLLDQTRTVKDAHLRILADSISGAFPVTFYLQPKAYAEGDSVSDVDTTLAIIDPTTGMVERTMQNFPATYDLPADLVQAWIRDDTARTAIAIVYTDTSNPRVATFKSRNTATTADRPRLQVNFEDGTQRDYSISGDATFIRPSRTTNNLVTSDGYVRRIHFRVDFDELSDSSAVHSARIVFNIVPNTLMGVNTTLVLYVPGSDDPTSAGFRTGTVVSSTTIDHTSERISLLVTNVVVPILAGAAPNTGFVLRFQSEQTELRAVELYGSDAADSLRPRAFFTSSTPATFVP